MNVSAVYMRLITQHLVMYLKGRERKRCLNLLRELGQGLIFSHTMIFFTHSRLFLQYVVTFEDLTEHNKLCRFLLHVLRFVEMVFHPRLLPIGIAYINSFSGAARDKRRSI